MLPRLLTPTTILSRRTFTSSSSLFRAMSLSPATSLKTSFGDLASKLNLSNPDLLRSTNYVDGEWVASSRPESESTFAVRDPSTDEVIGHAPDLTAEEVSRTSPSRSRRAHSFLRLADSFRFFLSLESDRFESPSKLPMLLGRAGPLQVRR